MKIEYLVQILDYEGGFEVLHCSSYHEAAHVILEAKEDKDNSAALIAVKEDGLPRWITDEERTEFNEIFKRLAIERKL